MTESRERFKFFFGVLPDEIPEKVILTPFARLDGFAGEVSRKFRGRVYSVLITGRDAARFAVVRSGGGASAAGDAALMLAEAGAREILFTGSCGALFDAGIGDLVVCEKAFPGEAFSMYHVPGDFSVDTVIKKGKDAEGAPELIDEVYGKCFSEVPPGVKCVRGKVYTTGSFMAENGVMLDTLERNGYIAVDMEVSAVYRAASSSGADTAALLYVSDLPRMAPVWRAMGKTDKERYERSVDTAVRLLSDMAAGYDRRIS